MVKLEKGELEAEIVNEGAYLVDLRKDGEEVLLHGNLERKTRGGMALLIPFANRVKGDLTSLREKFMIYLGTLKEMQSMG